MSDPVLHIVLVVVGILLGAAGGYLAFPQIREAKRLRVQFEALMQEHESYKSSVNSHFRKTADLVGEMTKSYAAVYDHLAVGARRFCDDSSADSKLAFEPLPGALAPPTFEAAAVDEQVAEAALLDEVRRDEVVFAESETEAELDSSSDTTDSVTPLRAAS